MNSELSTVGEAAMIVSVPFGSSMVTSAATEIVGGTVAILGGRGERLAGRGFRRELSAEAVKAIREEALSHTGDGHPFVPAHPAVAGRALAHPVISAGGGPPQAWVVIVRDSGGRLRAHAPPLSPRARASLPR